MTWPLGQQAHLCWAGTQTYEQGFTSVFVYFSNFWGLDRSKGFDLGNTSLDMCRIWHVLSRHGTRHGCLWERHLSQDLNVTITSHFFLRPGPPTSKTWMARPVGIWPEPHSCKTQYVGSQLRENNSLVPQGARNCPVWAAEKKMAKFEQCIKLKIRWTSLIKLSLFFMHNETHAQPPENKWVFKAGRSTLFFTNCGGLTWASSDVMCEWSVSAQWLLLSRHVLLPLYI